MTKNPDPETVALLIRSGFNKFKSPKKPEPVPLMDKLEEQDKKWSGRTVEADPVQEPETETVQEIEESDIADIPSAEVIEVEPEPVVAVGATPEPAPLAPMPEESAVIDATEQRTRIDVVTASSREILDQNTEEIVDKLFDRMQTRGLFDTSGLAREEDLRQIEASSSRAAEETRMLVAESKSEMASVVRSEIPKLLTKELKAVLKQEIVAYLRDEVLDSVRDEFKTVQSLMDKIADRITALEPRLARLEGAVDREIILSIPEGAISVPITIPEREVKVAAPINVQPPHVTFDKEAISVNFHKDSKGRPATKKKVKFNRDAYENIVDAEIVSE